MAEKIGDFIKRFDIDPVMATKFFVNLRDNCQVYIDNSTIEWMGYSGPLKKQRQQLSELLSRNFDEGKDYHIYDNASYAQWLSTLESHNYPPPPTGRGTYHTKHILLKADTFRELMMMLETSKARIIRKYYLQLEKLIKIYTIYQAACNAMVSKSTFGEVLAKLDAMSLKAEEDRVKAEEERKASQARFEELMARTAHVKDTLDETKNEVKIMNQKLDIATDDRVLKEGLPPKLDEYLVILKNAEPRRGERDYYTIRSQKRDLKARIKDITGDRDTVTTILKIASPNPKKLWQAYLDKYGHHVDCIGESDRCKASTLSGAGQWFNLEENRNERSLKRRIRKLHEQRKDV